MNYSPEGVRRALSDESTIILTHPRAALLTEHLEVAEGPSILIAGFTPERTAGRE